MNEDIFKEKGLHAVYAEYGQGQAAMTIYTDEAWDKLPK